MTFEEDLEYFYDKITFRKSKGVTGAGMQGSMRNS